MVIASVAIVRPSHGSMIGTLLGRQPALVLGEHRMPPIFAQRLVPRTAVPGS